MYYQTPRGIVQFRAGNKITLVSEFELSMATRAEEARKLIELNGQNGLNHLGQLLNNNMTAVQFNNSSSNPLNNPILNSQLNNNSGPLFQNRKANNQFLINNHFKQFGELPDLNYQMQMNAALQSALLMPNASNSQLLLPQQSTRAGRSNNFEHVYNEVAEEKDVEEDDGHFQADTYAEYMPSKLKIGLKHPDAVVETSSLSSVLPPNINYQPLIDEEIYDTGKLSALQMESIIYASQQHEQFLDEDNTTRAGFLIGKCSL